MIRLLTQSDYNAIYAFCARNPAVNLYFLGNLESLGVESDICQFYGSFDKQANLNGVLMRYMSGWNIADGPGCDYAGFGEIVDQHPAGAARLQDNTLHIESFQPFIQRYRVLEDRSEHLCVLGPLDFDATCKPWPIRRALMSDFDVLCRFYANAEAMTRSPRGVQRPLEDGRVFIVEVEKQIVCSVLTNAETQKQAMIGGVYTVPEHRGKGYARSAMVALCRSLFEDGLQPVLYYDNRCAGHIYRSLGFTELGIWRSILLAPAS